MKHAEPIEDPAGVLEAPSHPDPYPYYRRLVRGHGLYKDPALDCWVAADAAAVGAVLESPACHTRPAEGRVPSEIAAGPMAELFGRLVRQSDGPSHQALKPGLAEAVRSIELGKAAAIAETQADILIAEIRGLTSAAAVHRFLFSMPIRVLMSLLGAPSARFGDMATWLGDYGAATAGVITGIPEPTPELIAQGHAAAAALLAVMGELHTDRAAAGSLFQALVAGAADADPADLRANAAGLLAQGFASVSAVAALALLRMARDPALEARARSEPDVASRVIREVLRADPCTHSTLRFLACDAEIAGQSLRRGEKIIVLLAAASLDPVLNPEPERFDVDRADPKTFEFGRGAHACPADRLAPLLAEIAVRRVLETAFPLERLEDALSYAASAHIRTPRFA